ncbi:hypothetical protein Lfu02_41670 [Longispora fulva]|uniref:Uncharacterized protein n=1 Tax=Longispora fulva TaxID=619741 RepID=A0A8J7KKF1_9ACTN|nr:hypothetical protein [Longispora fulva]MBG6136626.1 hypothetical protein [Longispora fulva]GIG59795.1 hypothetical protein Lfu02_41670 [Longispora fulva]
MTRTENDLVSALRSIDPAEPETAALLAGVRRGIVRRRHRRRLAAAGGLALVVLATLTVPGLLQRSPAPAPADPPARPTLTTTVRLGVVDDLWFGVERLLGPPEPGHAREPAQTYRVLAAAQPGFAGFLEVYEPGAVDPDTLGPTAGAPPVTVAGRRAFYGSVDRRAPIAGSSQIIGDVYSTVNWEYAPGAWAVLYSDQGTLGPSPGRGPIPSLDELGRLAAKVTFGPPVPATAPIRFTDLPQGMAVQSARWSSPPPGSDPTTYHPIVGLTVTMSVFHNQGETADIEVLPRGAHQFHAGWGELKVVAGKQTTWYTREDTQDMWWQAGGCDVVFYRADRFRSYELEPILAHTTVADCTDRNTWSPIPR